MSERVRPRVGLLPLMLNLYRSVFPDLPKKQGAFLRFLATRMERFADVIVAEISTTRSEVQAAVRHLESEDVDLIAVVFIAYAPSLSALRPLLGTQRPLLLVSTVPSSSMGRGMSGEDILLNHGVHGYMDLANVLRRVGRPFGFVSGAKEDERLWRELEGWARAALAVTKLQGAKIGMVGYTFDGMGDLAVDLTRLNADLGPEIEHIPLTLLAEYVQWVSEAEVQAEVERDRRRYIVTPQVDSFVHGEANALYLALKQVIEDWHLDGFTMHFQAVLENPELKAPPFLGVSKLQEEGVAYAGEGDVLGVTANLVLKYLTGRTMFTEIFCPDFEGNRLVMAHMGESNPAFGVRTVLRRKLFPFGGSIDPVVADVEVSPAQRATLLNLAVTKGQRFQFTTITGEICPRLPAAEDVDMPYFHFRPEIDVAALLSTYGQAGGTHHFAITDAHKVSEIEKLADMMSVAMLSLE